MAKQRYSLTETMQDAAANIEEAKLAPAEEVKVEEVNLSPVEKEPEPVASFPAEESSEGVGEGLNKSQSQNVVASEKPKKKAKKVASIIESDTDKRFNVRNIELDDKTLWRLDTVKNKLNRERTEGAPLATQKGIINAALVEYLDRYYPDTKKAYEIINSL